MLLQTTTTSTAAVAAVAAAFTSPFQSTTINCIYYFNNTYHSKNSTSCLLPKTLFPTLDSKFHHGIINKQKGVYPFSRNANGNQLITKATLLEAPVLWVGRVCIFYALLKTGFAGSSDNPLVAEIEGGDLGFSKWFEELQSKPEKEASDKRKFVSKWHPTTKGTLRRNYRIPSKSEGRRLLKAIASLLSDDDHFRDATSHKGCQIRRENAHGETVCCNNVRALFDELPTPHLIIEITPFPTGQLSDTDYAKAEKLERVLRTGPSI